MVSRRWLYVMAATLISDLVLLGVLLGQEVQEFARGQLDGKSLLSMLALLVLVGSLAATFRLSLELTQARRELNRRDQVIAAAAATTDNWLWEADLDHRITYCSPNVKDLLGYAPEELVGRMTADLLFDDASRAAAAPPAGAPIEPVAGWARFEAVWGHRDGSAIPLYGTAVAIRDEKGRVVGYRGTRRPSNDANEARRQEVTAASQRIARALESDAFDIALQPVVSLLDGAVVGVEALARFDDGRSPDLWFRDAHLCRRTHALDERTFFAALRRFEALPEEVYLSVNASPELLIDPEFRRKLAASNVPLERLVIEITEHARIADYDQLNEAVDLLKEHQVRFAIDDTGAGYASMTHVLQLRPAIIKLDRALITHLNDDRARRSLVTALVLLALELGATVTGEGVETLGQLETLATLGVDHAQGFVIARPTVDREVWREWWLSPAGPRARTPPTPAVRAED